MKDEGRYLVEGAPIKVPRGMNGNKRPIAIAEHAIAVVTVLEPIFQRRNNARVTSYDRYLPCGLRRNFENQVPLLSSEIHWLLSSRIHYGNYETSVSGMHFASGALATSTIIKCHYTLHFTLLNIITNHLFCIYFYLLIIIKL